MGISVIDLFCGAGGLSAGMEAVGAEIIAGFDNDRDSLKTFEFNHKRSNAIHADLFEPLPDIKNFKGIDLIVGGPPCQGFSISGKRDPKDARNHLYKVYVETLQQLKPRMFILENVPNMISMDGGRFKDDVIKAIDGLGYKISVQVITASDHGVPQKRRRVFFFGSRDGLFELRNSKVSKMVNCKDAISDLPDYSLDEGQNYPIAASSNYQNLMRLKSDGVWNHILTDHSEKTKEISKVILYLNQNRSNLSKLSVAARKRFYKFDFSFFEKSFNRFFDELDD